MMDTFKKLYRDFFGLREVATPGQITTDDAKKAEEFAKKGMNVKLTKPGAPAPITTGIKTEEANAELDEAQLINKITDYRGGVEYVLRNPAEAKQVSIEIRQWAEKKGFVVIKQKISNNGKVGYFYFKLGQDPALESQKIQGYIAQKPEVKHFRFNVRGQKPQPSKTEI
jgi:hypothetical protein